MPNKAAHRIPARPEFEFCFHSESFFVGGIRSRLGSVALVVVQRMGWSFRSGALKAVYLRSDQRPCFYQFTDSVLR